MKQPGTMALTETQNKQCGDPFDHLKETIGGKAEVRLPGEAESPILAPIVRRALFQWMTEIRLSDDLKEVGIKPRTNALLYGPPGCGKTTLAHHFAARLGLPLVVVGAENVFAPCLGESEKRLADLFNCLDEVDTPCVLFMDELEAVGGSRDRNKAGGADNGRTSTLTVLLRKVEEYSTGYLVAATNRPDDIDPALWRRFNMQIAIDLPSAEERFAIIRRYLLPYRLSDSDIDIVSRLTDGASPSLLRELMEGIKRGLIIGPSLNLPSDAKSMFQSVVSSTMPPPEMMVPNLWRYPQSVDAFDQLGWPPSRGALDKSQ